MPKSMKRILPAASLIVVAVLAVLGVQLFLPRAGEPGTPASHISWTPTSLVITLSPGDTKTVQATGTIDSLVPAATVNLDAALAPYISVAPSKLNALPHGGVQTFQLTAAIPTNAPFQKVTGTVALQLRSGSQAIAQSLPVNLEIGPQFVDPTTGMTLSMPVLGPSATQATSTVTDTGIVSVHIMSLSLLDQSPLDQIDLIFLPNSSTAPFSQWFQQNVDPQGELLASGSFVKMELSNGMIAYVNTGPVPADYVDDYGPVLDVYAAFPSGGPIIEAAPSQVNELASHGYSADDQLGLVESVVASMQLP